MQATFPIDPEQDVTALILAGGRARRLSEQDKGLIKLGNTTLIEHVIGRLRPQLTRIAINANRNIDEYRQFGYPVIADSLPDFAGPLAGWHASLQNIQTEWVLSVPCDNPSLDALLLQTLTGRANQEKCLLTVASCEGHLQPVYCLLHRSLLNSLTDYLAAGKCKVRDWIGSQAHCIAEFDKPEAFENINTPEQLNEAEKNYV